MFICVGFAGLARQELELAFLLDQVEKNIVRFNFFQRVV